MDYNEITGLLVVNIFLSFLMHEVTPLSPAYMAGWTIPPFSFINSSWRGISLGIWTHEVQFGYTEQEVLQSIQEQIDVKQAVESRILSPRENISWLSLWWLILCVNLTSIRICWNQS
jgi:hypothetical protein